MAGTFAALVVLGGLPATAPAAASPAAVPWFGTYTGFVTGGQKTTWRLDDPGDGACQVAETGSGSESINLTGARTATFLVSGVGSTVLSMQLPDPDVTGTALVSRSGTITDGPPPPDTANCPSFGGGDGGAAAGPDCGTLPLKWAFSLQPGPSSLHVAAPLNAPDTDGTGFLQCPAQDTQWPGVAPADLFFPPVGLGPLPPLGTGQPLVEMDGVGVDPFASGTVTGSTSSTLKLMLSGAAVPTVAVFPDVQAVPVDSAGSARVPMACPKHVPSCQGKVSLDLSTGGGGDDDDDATPTYPAAVPQGDQALGTPASFSLKGGRRTTAKVKLGRGIALDAFADVDIDAVVKPAGTGRRATPYVIGRVTLKRG